MICYTRRWNICLKAGNNPLWLSCSTCNKATIQSSHSNQFCAWNYDAASSPWSTIITVISHTVTTTLSYKHQFQFLICASVFFSIRIFHSHTNSCKFGKFPLEHKSVVSASTNLSLRSPTTPYLSTTISSTLHTLHDLTGQRGPRWVLTRAHEHLPFSCITFWFGRS